MSEYVDWIGERLSRAVEGPRFDYRFEVIASAGGHEPFGFPGGFVFVPHMIRKERALSARLMADALAQSKPLGIEAVADYATSLGSRLTNAIFNRRLDYRFEVRVHPEAAEPFGFPGGFMLIPAKFFLEARSEAEFAGMLAHMIGHIEQRHGTMPVPSAGSGRMIPLIFLGGWAGAHTDAGSVLVPRGLHERQRVNELAADQYAVPILAAAGFDGEGLRRYIARVEAGRGERLAALGTALAGVDSRPTGESGFDEMRELVRAALRPSRTVCHHCARNLLVHNCVLYH